MQTLLKTVYQKKKKKNTTAQPRFIGLTYGAIWRLCTTSSIDGHSVPRSSRQFHAILTNSLKCNSGQPPKHSEVSRSSNGEDDEEWSQISEMHSRIAHFRNKSIDKWQRKSQVTTGAAAFKSKLHAFNKNISEQVAAYMWDPSRVIKGMQQSRSTVAIFGIVPDAQSNTKEQDTKVDGDPELLDDSEFYQQLLKEFFETFDPASSESTFYALKRMQTKKRKIVDRRASKCRKIRYNVHEKIVNFMAPQPVQVPPMAPKLFENLFGLKTQKTVSVV
ncbi:hypothetical protein TEA_004975 [Camellia sinensis var. sinensis]|uniref:Apoptosis-antagonizing transcription factor C-terminal domain-containing protein n=1 Tax=Camellia sinensis var. sinensis TaxID=542762 RepID=A0A4S4EDY8_CAMSN|nr:hypothetical protein TEA_004975 [Camellia sinensis var. sinensis]